MLSKNKSIGRIIDGFECLAIAALTVAIIGCGGEKGDASKAGAPAQVTKSRPATTVEFPTVDVERSPTATAPEPALASVAEPPRVVTYAEAEAAFHDKCYDQAAELFALYTDRKSENPWGFFMLGLSAWKAGDHDDAETAFTRALELDQRHVKSWIGLTRVLLDTGRPEEALDKIDEALAIDTESNSAYRLRGRAYHQLGRKEDAGDAYRKAIRIDNGDAWSMNNLGLVYIQEGRFEEALPPLARAIELKDNVAIFYNNLGMALERTGHFRAAEEAYEAAVNIDGSYEKATVNLSRVEVVVEDPGLEPVDLGVIAQSFVDEIESWSDTAVASAQSETVVPEAVDIIIIDADSTDSDQER